jgi:hypothetical protein
VEHLIQIYSAAATLQVMDMVKPAVPGHSACNQRMPHAPRHLSRCSSSAVLQVMDMVKPAVPGRITKADLVACKQAGTSHAAVVPLPCCRKLQPSLFSGVHCNVAACAHHVTPHLVMFLFFSAGDGHGQACCAWPHHLQPTKSSIHAGLMLLLFGC